MLIVVVRHRIRPGRYDAAKTRLKGNAARMMKQPGFLFRHTGDAEGGAEIVTVTAWKSKSHREAWDALKATLPAAPMSDFYTGYEVIDVEVFDQAVA